MAIIDIGSNSVKLLLETTNQKFVVLTRLAQGLDKTNRLNEAAIRRTADTVGLFFLSAKKAGERVLIFATEAARANGSEMLVDLIYKKTQIRLEIISGRQEAEYAFIGAADAALSDKHESQDDTVAVLDAGGASTEICIGSLSDTRPSISVYKKSIPIGAVRLLERFDSSAPFTALLDDVLKYIDSFLIDLTLPRFSALVLSGGTSSAITAIKLNLKEYDSTLIHKQVIFADEIKSILDTLFILSPQQLISLYPFLEKGRAETLPYGTAIIYAFMKKLNILKAIKSENGVTEGYLKKNK